MSALATYTLTEPVEIKEADGNVRTYTEVNILRKAKVKDMKGVNFGGFAAGKFGTDDIAPVLGRISDVPQKVMEEMLFIDMLGLFEVAAPFFIGT